MKTQLSGILVLMAFALTACEKTPPSANATQGSQTQAMQSQAKLSASQVEANLAVTEMQMAHMTAHGQAASGVTASGIEPTKPLTGEPRAIDWAAIDSGVTAVDPAKFNYPFALDSAPVKAYMDAYHVDAQTARYNLTVGMAVNEVLGKVLDQVGTSYVSHELTAGKGSKFIIHTTARIQPSQHNYVFAEPFAHGLSMPVEVVNDGKK